MSNGGVRNPPTRPSTTTTCALRFTASRKRRIVIADIKSERRRQRDQIVERVRAKDGRVEDEHAGRAQALARDAIIAPRR